MIMSHMMACSLKWTELMEHFTGVLCRSEPFALLPIHTFTVMTTAAVQGATWSSLLDCARTPSINVGTGTVISHSIFGAKLQHRIHLIYSPLMSKKDLFRTKEIRFKLFFFFFFASQKKKKLMNECDHAGYRNWRVIFGLHGLLSAALYIQSCSPLWIHSIYRLFQLFFIHSSLFSPDSISSLSSLHIPSVLPSRFLSRSNSVHLCVHTPGCCGNGERPHKRVDEQKTWRPSSTEMESGRRRDGTSNFICISIFLGKGLMCDRAWGGSAEGAFGRTW